MKLLTFLKYKTKDLIELHNERKNGIVRFEEYGLDLYAGCQGSGKTMSLVYDLEQYRLSYPNLFIATNFGYIHQDMALSKFEDIEKLPKLVREAGYAGLVIGWDEIQNDFDNQNRSFPLAILRTITQQRKQGIKVLATSQVYTTVHKRLREQTFNVINCKTFWGRWTFQRGYDPKDYEFLINNPDKFQKLSPRFKNSFIQTDAIRELYDSYAVIDNLAEYRDADAIPIEIRFQEGFRKNDATIKELQEVNNEYKIIN